MTKSILFFIPAILAGAVSTPYMIVDTGQELCFSEQGQVVSCFSTGQDASYGGNLPNYTDNGNGTVTDNVTGLMWQQDPGDKMTYEQAVSISSSFSLAGYSDWRLPTIKELYSLILFSGTDPSGLNGEDTSTLVPFIDTDYFVFEYGDTSAGERIIDSQYASSTKYVSTTMNGMKLFLGSILPMAVSRDTLLACLDLTRHSSSCMSAVTPITVPTTLWATETVQLLTLQPG